MMLDFFRSCIVRVGSKSLLFIDIYGILMYFAVAVQRMRLCGQRSASLQLEVR